MKRFNSLMLTWIVSVVVLSVLEAKAEKVPCLIFSGKAEKERNIDLSKLNRIRFGDNSMVLTSTKDAKEPFEELQYSLYHRIRIGDAEPTVTQAERIVLSQETATLRVGQTVGLTATVLPETALDKTVRWTSSNSSVAQVDAEGRVTAMAVGKATITATCGTVSASCVVTVEETPAESVTLSQENASIYVGETLTLTATVKPEDATSKSVKWTSNNEKVATVDAEGKVIAVSPGTAIITATCGTVRATCVVSVIEIPVRSLEISQETATLKVGETLELKVKVNPSDATNKNVRWASSDESVAMVEPDGKVTAVAPGQTTITALCGTAKADCVVTVVADQGGIDALGDDSDARIYVDAVGKQLYIEAQTSGKFAVSVFGLDGTLLLATEAYGGDAVSLESLTAGAYVAVAYEGKTQLTNKFILK